MTNFKQAEKLARSSFEEWKKQNLSEEAIISFVNEHCAKFRRQIFLQLMGFRHDSWHDKLEVDSCNGRAGESVAGDHLKKTCAAAVAKWLEENVSDLPKLSKKETRELLTVYRREFAESIRRQVRELAYENGKEAAEKMIATIVQADSAN